jgi:Glu-tRNA(Gln) amidotransferase subunit E-like FAD-binding protein
VPAGLAAVILVQYPKRLRKKSVNTNLLEASFLAELLQAVGTKKLHKEGILPAMETWLRQGTKIWQDWQSIIPAQEWQLWIQQAIAVTEARRPLPARHKQVMGQVMARMAGRLPGAQIAAAVQERLQAAS